MTKCAAFWHHTNIRNDNKIFPCCRFKTPIAEFTGDVVNILNSKEYQAIREQSLSGVPIAGCEKCYYEERLGKPSMREQFNKDYNTDEVSLDFLEIGLDNICNLTCDGCWDEFSSSWAKKNNPAVIPIRSSHEIKNLPDSINKVVFLGGEPLMTTRHIKLLKMVDRSKLDVTYNTNGTFLLDNNTIDLLKDCARVKFILSIDGYGDLNEQVRSGSKWKDIVAFIDQITSLEFNLVIHTVIHKNNWHGLPELANFIHRCHFVWTTNILTYPKHLDIVNIDDKTKIVNLINTINIPNKEYILKHLHENIKS
jgi:sulfatase maturation enzyme AslB (radical SAM superfamily)